jgi:Fe-S cluster assembly iron-binding protein IscA
MNNLFIDERAIEFMKKAIESEKASAMRIFTSGGGCCKQFEITPINKALTGDVMFKEGGIIVYIEKTIADNTGTVSINFNENKGLLIEFE